MSNSKLEDNDYCMTSVGYLHNVILEYFKNKGSITNIWFCDTSNFEEADIDKSIPIDIVLMGNQIVNLLNFPLNEDLNVRFWVLSNSSKKLLTDLFDIPSEKISVIPRFELFKQPKKIKLSTNETINLVVAGRISEVKNIYACLKLYSELEKRMDIRLHFYGWFDNQSLYDRPIKKPYKEIIQNYIKNNTWLNEPIFIHDLGPKEWVEKVPNNSLFLSLSTFPKEDFSVCVSQAYEIGLPMILSQWGGHNDFEGKSSVCFVSSGLIPHHMEPSNLVDYKVMKLANAVDDYIRDMDLTVQFDEQNFIIPELLITREIEECVKKFCNRFVEADNIKIDLWYIDYLKGNYHFCHFFNRIMRNTRDEKDFIICLKNLFVSNLKDADLHSFNELDRYFDSYEVYTENARVINSILKDNLESVEFKLYN